jgi:acyl-CoA thioester hydrolase
MSQLNIRVYYEDTDSGGVVYYANYLKFIERARTEFLREMGFEQSQLGVAQNIVFAVKSLQAQYLSPARFDDLLTVYTDVEKSRHASLIFSQKIKDFKKNKVLFKAQITVACLTLDNFKPCAIPNNILENINGQ